MDADGQSGRRREACIVRAALVCLFAVALLGVLLGIVFIYMNVNDRLSRLEKEVFGDEDGSVWPNADAPESHALGGNERRVKRKREVPRLRLKARPIGS